jgi:putative endonuclease
MVRCRGGFFYVGITDDVDGRVKDHNLGVGSTFTAQRRPVELVWREEHESQSAARDREVKLKGWSRKKKLALMAASAAGNPNPSARISPAPQDKGE